MAAGKQELDALHRALVAYMLSRMEAADATDKPLPAAELAVFVKFVKDNGIVADSKDADDLLELQAQLEKEKTDAGRREILDTALSKLVDDSEIMH